MYDNNRPLNFWTASGISYMVAEQRQQRRAKTEEHCNVQTISGLTKLLDNLIFAGRCNVVLTREFVEARVLNPQSHHSTFDSDARRVFIMLFAPRNFPFFRAT